MKIPSVAKAAAAAVCLRGLGAALNRDALGRAAESYRGDDVVITREGRWMPIATSAHLQPSPG